MSDEKPPEQPSNDQIKMAKEVLEGKREITSSTQDIQKTASKSEGKDMKDQLSPEALEQIQKDEALSRVRKLIADNTSPPDPDPDPNKPTDSSQHRARVKHVEEKKPPER